jgi:phosphoribulokinase
MPSESVLVVHFRDGRRHDFPDLMRRIPGAYMARPSTMVVPGGELKLALEVICTPILGEMMEARQAALADH